MEIRLELIGLLRQPKYDHLKELHKAIKSSERAILSADPAFVSLGTYEQCCDKPVGITSSSAPSLSMESEGHALHVYVNNQLIGSAFGGPESRKVQFIGNANLRAGINKISLLSVTIGLPVNCLSHLILFI
ncbi:glycoside hydrolase, family 35 [Tanacetum coccineum]